MGDRQDIDALLIGALYGELDAADKERLESHLSTHPADRAAMDTLAATRTQVRDNLSRMTEAEPAPAITALLLREAARRAPRRVVAGGGVMAWLSAMFRPIVAHPAMAGAFALLLAGGAAGILYKSGKVTEESHATATESTGEASPGRVAATAPRADERAPDSFEVKLAESRKDETAALVPAEKDKNSEGDGLLAKDRQQIQLDGKDDTGNANPYRHAAGSSGAPKPATPAPKSPDKVKQKGSGYVEVRTREPQLKTFEDQSEQVAQGLADPSSAGGGGGGNAGPAASTTTATTGGAPPARPSTQAPAYDRAKDAKLDEWAQVQHRQLQQLVKAGKCAEAGKVGSDIAGRAPEYYAANVENDRAIRGCKQYIDQAKRKKANEEYKSRARNSYDADMEAPAPAAH